jgi:hypothetical protein
VLVESGHLVPVIKSEEMTPTYHPSDLDHFLEKLTALARPVDNCAPGEVTLVAATKRSNARLTEIVDLVLGAKLEWVGTLTSDRGFSSVLVKLAEVKEKVKLPPVDGITPSAVADDFGITDKGVRHLIGVGALPTVVMVNPANRCPMNVVPSTDYQQFKAEFISLRDIARARGQPSRTVENELALAGILPVNSWRKNGAILFRRSELT